MKPERESLRLLGTARSKAKMLEYDIPEEHHIALKKNPAKLFSLAIGLLGDLAAKVNREGPNSGRLMEMQKDLHFSAHFFDSYVQTKLTEALDPYVLLLGAASYYLCDLSGSSSVLAKRVGTECPDLDGGGLEDLLLWLLQADLEHYFDGMDGPFGELINTISLRVLEYFNDGTGEEELLELGGQLQQSAYDFGTPRQLLLADVVAAVLKTKLRNSTWKSLPDYSGLSRQAWSPVLKKDSFMKELWPAQHLVGKANVLKGESAVIQMPTSAGKTKATELILRSGFLANRVSLAIVVAPFRALCHEITNSLVETFQNEDVKIDELSDAVQADFQFEELTEHRQVLIVTPEKLLYVLRHSPELADQIGLLVFDEGHQFDSDTRGINYELLLTSLRRMVPEGVQKVLISAVITNAEEVAQWLNGTQNVVYGLGLSPTFRSVGFVSWVRRLGRIEYVDSNEPEKPEFFVPRVIKKTKLKKRPRERKDRYFPEQGDSQAIALYLGLKLVPKGSVAVFCGTKAAATGICERAVDLFERDSSFAAPKKSSHGEEIARQTYLHEQNLGAEATATRSVAYGVLSHHGNTPHGIRLAAEFALREGLMPFVVCTSTLAQGVNLPIRYLIVTSVYQGQERIKVRDFHNLIGRAGRAGIHTEGSILFADPGVYDKRMHEKEGWRWRFVGELLDPTNSEQCASSLARLFPLNISNAPNKAKDRQRRSLEWNIQGFAKEHIKGRAALLEMAKAVEGEYGGDGFTVDVVMAQFESFSSTLSSIEGFLLANLEWGSEEDLEGSVGELAEESLAYFLADPDQKTNLQELFHILARNIFETVQETDRKISFGRTLYGVNDAKAIEEWVRNNMGKLEAVNDSDDFIELVWPLMLEHIHHRVFRKFDNKEVLKKIVLKWMTGTPFSGLFRVAQKNKCRIGKGARPRKVKIEHIVDICENGLAYDGGLLVGAVCEFVERLGGERLEELVDHLQLLQKRLKYGLSTETAVVLFELGFSDRVISQDLEGSLSLAATNKTELIEALENRKKAAKKVINKYPRYFHDRLNEFLG